MENTSNAANVDTTAFTAISCITGKFFNQLLFITVVPLLFGIILPFLAYVIGRNCVKNKTRLMGNCLNVCIAVLIAAYPSTSKKVFATFLCDDGFVSDDAGYLAVDYTFRCDDPEYETWKSYSMVMVGIFPIGIPVVLTALLLWLYCNQKMYRRDSEGNVVVHDEVPLPQDFAAQVFGSLFLGVDANCFWFESYDMFRKLMLTSVLGLIYHDLNSQIVMASLFVLFNLCVTALVNPYTHASTDRLSFTLCLSLLMMLIFGLAHNFTELLYKEAIASGDVIKMVSAQRDINTTHWQSLIFAAVTFGYGCIGFEMLTHPYHVLEHRATYLTIKYGQKVTKYHIWKALFGCLDKKNPAYRSIEASLVDEPIEPASNTKVAPSLKSWEN